MAKYRPIDTRIWNDRKFLSLSQDGRMLWLFLLTSPSTLAIPGVIVAGEASIAEQLGWDAKRLRERFRELFQRGLAIKVEGRLVWLCNATKYQPPANPNVVKGWSKCWDDVPECGLKHDVWQALKVACKSWDRTFAKQFAEPFRHGSANGSGNGYTQDQDQDQEQEQEQDLDSASTPSRAAPAKSQSDFHLAIAAFDTRFKSAYGTNPSWEKKQFGQIKQLLKSHGREKVERHIANMFDAPPTWIKPPFDLGTLVSNFDKFTQPSAQTTLLVGRIEPKTAEAYADGEVSI